ncbi:Uncharacterised protein [Prevotella melaninogenica]|nr:Uncharacterised protein [Prevotella melaninogenica]
MTKFTKANWMTRVLQEKLSVVGEQGRRSICLPFAYTIKE